MIAVLILLDFFPIVVCIKSFLKEKSGMSSQGHIFRSWKERGTGECGGSEVVKVAEFSGGSFPEERKTGFFSKQERMNQSWLWAR